MKKYALLLVCVAALLLSGCGEFEFADYADDTVTLTYQDHMYTCIAAEECPYTYKSSDMVFLYATESGELNDMEPTYNVYRHTDDETPEYLFVVPKPQISDAIAVAFVLKLQDMAETSA